MFLCYYSYTYCLYLVIISVAQLLKTFIKIANIYKFIFYLQFRINNMQQRTLQDLVFGHIEQEARINELEKRLSNVKKICFRGFKGELLPFTSIDLPKLRVEVVLTGENVSEATITGKDGIYGKSKYYNITNEDGNVLLTFDKAWTYDAEEDNQLLYNIKEAVQEVNRRLKVMYPFKTYYNEYDLSETHDDNYTNKIYFDIDLIPINNNPGSSVLGWSKSKKVML